LTFTLTCQSWPALARLEWRRDACGGGGFAVTGPNYLTFFGVFAMSFRVAVVGATGAVGREILKTLSERNFPISEVAAVASGRSAGAQVSFGEDRVLTVKNLEKFDFTGWDIALFSPGRPFRRCMRRGRRRRGAW